MIGDRFYPVFLLRNFESSNTLTEANLIGSYANRAAYEADTNRRDNLFALFADQDKIYLVDNLELLGTNAGGR